IKEAPIKGVERVSTEHEGEESVLLAFRTVPYKSQDKPALTIIDMLLDSGQEGLIKLNLVNPQKLISAGSYPTYNNDYGSESLYASLKNGQKHLAAEKLLLSQIEKIKKGQFDFSLTKGIILSFEVAKKAELENNVSRVAIMRDAFIKGVSPNDSMEFIDQLKHVTKEQIVKAANKYFNNYVAGYRYNRLHTFPKIVKPEIEKIKLNPSAESNFAKQVESINTSPISPKWVDYNKDFKVTSVAPGVFLYYVNNPINNLFSFSVNYDYGDKHYDNFCYVMDELNFAGTGKISAGQIKNDFFKLGVNSSFSCGDYGFSLSLSGIDNSFEKALQLSENVLWKANLDQNHLKERVNNIVSVRQDSKKDQESLKDALNTYIRYNERSGYLDRPTANELKKISVSSYPAMKEALKKQNFKIYYTGQLPMDKVVSLVKKYHQPTNIIRPLLVPAQEPANRLEKRNDKPIKMYVLDYKGIQSYISLIVPEKQVNPKEAMLESVYNQYISSIFYQEIRESRALAYTANSSYVRGNKIFDQDQMTGFIGTQADKTVDSIKAAIELYKNHDKSVADFKRSKKAVENSYRTGYVGFRSILGAVDYWSELGYDKDPRPEQFSMLNKLQFNELQKFINERVSSKNLVFTIVGDKDKINLEELKKIGDVEEIDIKNIFKD
ncbi:MAG: insulinase family protein, partial [Candidatus Sericytochromatia bacterium]|nr:insulinase family protein [Candidatus Sericytochromatia bacterium]